MQPAEMTITQPRRARKPWTWERVYPILTLLPSIIAIAVFVYGFIVWTGVVSFTKWNTLVPDLSWNGFANYRAIFQDFRFQSDLRNLLFFTVLFVLVSMIIGLFLAVLVDQKIRLEGLFRSLFIFPMAIAFIVTGVVWQWLLNPSTGVNLILKALGLTHLPKWYVDITIVPSIPWGHIKFGLPLALLAVIIAAVWQMSGFAMALYLSGLRSIPDDLKEAAAVDGANAWTTFWRVILPQLNAVTVTVVIMLIHISMKTFDLIYAMTGPGAAFVTDMPSMDMFQTTFQGNHYAQGAAISIIMLLLLAIFIVPYLTYSLRGEKP
ncbi:carbohydrate ABC transporter permease [Alicyclobacillus shizuokensis]|uniref:carbohydrate ABC transporter permease n=1 Tax=Alicyclobacillus shizuokensis TaxID=392014 RepID=UPI00082E03B9|nr:sugar ABC transporter permease [Alicyclobacillus shizuokensis]